MGGAEVYAAKAQALLIKHKITLSELERSEALGDDPIGSEDHTPGDCPPDKRCWWAMDLAYCTARAHFCKAIGRAKGSDFIIVGRAKDREIALYMFDYLSNVMQILAMIEAQQSPSGLTGRGISKQFRDSFYKGFIDGVAKKYQDAMTDATASEGGTALTVCHNAVQDWASSHFELGPARSALRGQGGAGYTQGRIHGSNMNLGRRGVPAPSTRRIS